jgi:hypothetical protein
MAATVSVTTLTIPKSNINQAITQSTFSASEKGNKINEISLTEIQNAINKLETYIAKVNNCGNCNLISSNSTSCQTVTYNRYTYTAQVNINSVATAYVDTYGKYSKNL